MNFFGLNRSSTARFSKIQGTKQSKERWEWDVKRQKKARDWKKERTREKCESHTAALIPACVHLCPCQTPCLASSEFICVCVLYTQTEKDNAHWSASVWSPVFMHVCACMCICELSQQGWKHKGWRAHVAKHLVQRRITRLWFFLVSTTNKCCWGHYLSE